jgi:cob(I)alamin adenosyltransferase
VSGGRRAADGEAVSAHEPPREPPKEAPRPSRAARARSLVVVNTGDGKGKTTAAMGTLLRAVARGWRVCVIQFIKSGRWKAGEEVIARRLGVEWWTLGDGFSWESADLDRSAALARSAWEAAKATIASGAFDLVVLDEITYPMNWDWIPTAEVVAVIRNRPVHVNVVATGRDAPPALVEVADTVTEMRKVRHAYDRGIRARRGIDF